MRDEHGGHGGWRWAAAVTVGVAFPAVASGQSVRGVAEVNYQNTQAAALPSPFETWGKSLALDYSRTLPGAIDFASRFRFAEQTVSGRADRFRVPEGNVRLAHRNAGLSAHFRPSETRDATGFTSRRQDLTLSGYAQRPGLPSVSGSWVRNHVNSNERTLGAATVTRSLGALYFLPRLALRAGYGDRLLEPDASPAARLTENHFTLGATSTLRLGRAPLSLQYDFGQGRNNPSGGRSQTSRNHTASASTAYPFTRKLSGSLGYNYRRTDIVAPSGPFTEDHSGAASLAYALRPGVTMSGGGGIRSATIAGQTRTERFLVGGIGGDGQVRQNWRIGASATHSTSWIPGEKTRPTDSFQSNTTMQLTRGLTARADLGIGAIGGVSAADSLASLRNVTLQTGAGITATPLRTVYVDARVQRSRAASSLFEGGVTSSAYSLNLRLAPTGRLQTIGGWSRIRGPGSESRTFQASLQWTPLPSFQTSGSYHRGRSEILEPLAVGGALQEGFSAGATTALGREMNASVQYSEANRGQSTEVRQVSVNVGRRFGR
jgi:hypothetical protein